MRRLIEPLLADLEVELFDVVWGGGRLLVTVEADGGVDTDQLARISRTISQELDLRDPMPGRYNLEVSSPGLERRLRRPEHYAKSVGQTVTLKLAGEQKRLQGVIVDAGETEFSIQADAGEGSAAGSEESQQTIPYSQVLRAQTVFVWGKSEKSQKQQPKKSQPKSSRQSSNQSSRPSSKSPSNPSPRP